jgi:hypothetical protein
MREHVFAIVLVVSLLQLASCSGDERERETSEFHSRVTSNGDSPRVDGGGVRSPY